MRASRRRSGWPRRNCRLLRPVTPWKTYCFSDGGDGVRTHARESAPGRFESRVSKADSGHDFRFGDCHCAGAYYLEGALGARLTRARMKKCRRSAKAIHDAPGSANYLQATVV